MDHTVCPSEQPTTAPPASAGVAAAARLTTLLRLLPLQRHEVLGHVSVLKLAATVLKRRISTGRFETESGLESVTSVQDHAGHIVGALELVRVFEPGSRTEAVGPAQAVALCLQAMRPLFNACGHRVLFDTDAAAAAPVPALRVANHDMVAVVAAALLHALDAADGPTELTVTIGGDRLEIGTAALPSAQGESGMPATAMPIRSADLHALAAEIGLGLQCAPGSTVVRWGAGA